MGYHRKPTEEPKVDLGDFKPERDANGHFVKGKTANPKGRPKDSVSIITVLKRKLRENPNYVEDIADQFIKLARRKNYKQLEAMKEILDRIDGKVVETHKLEIENPVTIEFVPATPAPEPQPLKK